MTKMFSPRGTKTIYLSLEKDLPLIKVIGLNGFFTSKRYLKINENEKEILFEIIPEVKLPIKTINFEKR